MFICPVLLFHCLFVCSTIARRDERCLQNTLLKTLPTEATALVNFPLAFCFVLLQVLSLFPVPFAAWAAHEDSLFTYDSSDWLWITVEKKKGWWKNDTEGREQNTRAMSLSNYVLFIQGVNKLICIFDLRRWELEIVGVSLPTGIIHPPGGGGGLNIGEI